MISGKILNDFTASMYLSFSAETYEQRLQRDNTQGRHLNARFSFLVESLLLKRGLPAYQAYQLLESQGHV